PGGECPHARAEFAQRRVDARLPGAGSKALETVVAHIPERLEPDQAPGLGRTAPADAGDERVARLERSQELPCRPRHGRILGARRDRRERAVDVEDQGRAVGPGEEGSEQLLCGRGLRLAVRGRRHAALVSPTMSRPRLVKLAAIGTAAGVFSALFGVGGGTVIVPLLIFWFAYGE